ncbi:MAG: hypothetical protein AAGK74_20060, partial [Chloroflexota bacterium]
MVKDLEDSPEALVNGVYRQVSDAGAIVVYGVRVKARRATNRWGQMVMQDAETWPDDAPYLTMHYFTEGAVEQTPYNRAAATRMARTIPRSLQGRMAVVIEDIPLAHMARTFTGYMLGLLLPRGVQSAVFTDYDEGLAWLQEAL